MPVQPRNHSNVTRPFPVQGFGAGYETKKERERGRGGREGRGQEREEEREEREERKRNPRGGEIGVREAQRHTIILC